MRKILSDIILFNNGVLMAGTAQAGTPQAGTPQTDDYDDGFLDASEQEALGESVRVRKIETFRELLQSNPDAPLTFWKCWFLGSVPWSRRTITPIILWRNPDLEMIYYRHVPNTALTTPVC